MEKAILIETPFDRSGTVDFDALVRTHGRLLFNIAYAVLRNVEDAEDVVQEAFFRAFRSRKIGKVERMHAWLGRIAWRLALNRYKKRSRDGRNGSFEELESRLTAPEPGVEELILKEEKAALLERLLLSLPDDLRNTFLLLTVEEMTSPVVAEILGISESSVRDRMYRARKLLRKKLSTLMEYDHGT